MAEALFVIDVQNDFVPPDGALAVPDGDEVVEPINELMRSGRFGLVVATRDWHPPDHASFQEQGGPWPTHCVRDTPGAQLVDGLDRDAIDVVLDTGRERTSDGYSAFEREELRELLRSADVDAVTVTGLATDVCVLHTARDALREGLRVRIVRDAVRGIDRERSAAALEELERAGAQID